MNITTARTLAFRWARDYAKGILPVDKWWSAKSATEAVDLTINAVKQNCGYSRLPAGWRAKLTASSRDGYNHGRRVAGRLARVEAERLRRAHDRTPEGRAEIAIRSATYRRSLCQVGGGHHVEVRIIDHRPSIQGSSRPVYAPGGYQWSGNDSVIKADLRPSWIRKVLLAGIAVIDGMVTIDAERIPRRVLRRLCGPDSPICNGWVARWAVQSRGFGLRVVSGFIFEGHATERYGRMHSERVHIEEQDRESGIRRGEEMLIRREAQVYPVLRMVNIREDIAGMGGSVEQWAEVRGASDHLDLEVTIHDSHSAGNCRSGTDHWRERYLPGRSTATVREIMTIALAHQDSVALAGGACLVALRRVQRGAEVQHA